MNDREFERLAVLHAMGALSEEEAERFHAARQERGRGGDHLVQGVQRAFTGTRGGAAATVPTERADLAAVTSAPLPSERPRPWIALAILLALLLAGALGWALWLQSRRGAAEEERRAASRRADSLALRLTASEEALAGLPRTEELAPVLAATELVGVPLTGGGGAEGRIFLAGETGALLVARGLPALEEGAAYRLWRIGAAGAEPVATLGDAPHGFLFIVFSNAGFLENGDRLQVTAESDPESPGPSGPVLLEGVATGIAR